MKKLLLLLAPLSLSAAIELVHENPDSTTQLYFLSMAGAYEHVSGSPHRAQQTYDQVTQLAPESVALQHAALRLAFEREDYAGVIARASHVNVTTKSHQEAALYLAQAYLFTGQITQALALLNPLSKKYPDHERVDYFIALCHLRNNDSKRAHRVIDAVLSEKARESKHFLFHFLKAKLLSTEEKLPAALTHSEKALIQHPRFSKGILLHGALLERSGHAEAALAQYEKYLDVSKDSVMTKKVIAMHFDAKNFARARTLLLSIPQNSADYFHDLAMVSFQLGENGTALSHLEHAFAKDPRHQRSQDLKTHILQAQKDIAGLTALYTGWLHQHPRNTHLLKNWYQLALNDVGVETGITVLERVTRRHPTHQACFALADLLQGAQEYAAARTWYQRALEDTALTRHGLLESKLHFQIACTHYREAEFSLAYDAVQKALSCVPPYPSAHNLAALIILEAGGSTHRAQEHIDHALLAAPHYAPYIATRQQLAARTLPE